MVYRMKILFLAAEAAPFAKVGGLADVAGELPAALRALGLDVRLVLPFHPTISRHNLNLTKLLDVEVPHSQGVEIATVFEASLGGSSAFLIDGKRISESSNVYDEPDHDTHKFTFTSIAAMIAMQALGWRPDLLHAHDWHASPAVIWLSRNRDSVPYWSETASLLTIHNLPYMGNGGILNGYGLPSMHSSHLPSWAEDIPIAMGIAVADRINAVSPSYAMEIQTAAFGHGLEGLLIHRREFLSGILNGIDNVRWNPITDESLPSNFSRDSLRDRRNVKQALLEKAGLPNKMSTPLIGMVTRLDDQKGVDIALDTLSQITDADWQFILLGSGDPSIETMVKTFANLNRENSHVRLAFDPQLARMIYAGADMILIPSRYEPCGLTQMIAMRYGSVPVVSATGGLKDTVIDYRMNPKGTGFVFDLQDRHERISALRSAINTYHDQRKWRGLQLRGMGKDFSWTISAMKYRDLYKQTLNQRRMN
jgi:starch synthase